MNAEVYLFRGTADKYKAVDEALPTIAEELKSQKINIIYKTRLNEERQKIVEAVKQSVSPNENIETIIIPNAYDKQPEESIVYKAICGLCAKGDTVEKDYLLDKKSASTKNYAIGTEVANGVFMDNIGEGNRGYCFFLQGRRIILLPQMGKEALMQFAPDAIGKAAAAQPIPDNQLCAKGIKFALNNQPLDNSTLRESPNDIASQTAAVGAATEVAELNLDNAKEAEIGELPEDEKPQKPKKNFFVRNFVPTKDDTGKEKARKIIFDVAIVVFLVTAIILLNVLVIQPLLNNQKYDELREEVKPQQATEVVTSPDTGEVVATLSHDWDKLHGINKEIIGWVTINNTVIDYPVLQHDGDNDDSQYYLYRDYNKDYSGYGSIFMDYRSNKGTNSKNMILHGHHMNDGSMFQNLMYYGLTTGDLDFYKKSPTIRFDTADGDGEYKIISVFKTNTEESQGEFFNYLTGSFDSDAEFMNYVYLVRVRSLIDCPVNVNENDQLITLSTCSYEYSEFRTVIVARKVRAGEDASVDVSKAKLNSNPLWPDVYYGGNLSAKPKVTTFSTAVKAGEINWYDGKGNLKGKERMFTLHDNETPTAAPTNEEIVPTQDVPTDPPEETLPAETTPPATNPPVVTDTGITFDYSSMTMNGGDTETLTILWNPEDVSDKSITWSTSNTSVATIAAGGKVTAHNPGTCTITATTKQGNVASCDIEVHVYAQNMTISRTTAAIPLNSSVVLSVAVSPANAEDKAVTWSSNNTGVATVDQNGKVTGVASGNATITASAGNLSISCQVTVN